MGLRIIDRSKSVPPVEVSESDLLAGVASESKQWRQSRESPSGEFEATFIAKYRKIRARMRTPGEVTASAQRVRDRLAEYERNGASAHAKVDIATLLELL